MSPEPNGSVVRTASGRDLILTRELSIPVEEAWAWVSDSPKLEKWFGSWTGDTGPGSKIEVRMNAEEEDSTSVAEITACEPGHSYELTVGTEMGQWFLGLAVESSGTGTLLTFTQHLDEATPVGSIGAGWEWYLDRLVSAIDGTPEPDFNEYWPAMGPYYEDQ